MADSERDSASCSGGDEDSRSDLHSPSASEDSVEVQVTPISLRNKRKLAEPRKIQEQNAAPLKKRRFHQIEETVVVDEESRPMSTPSPFRPWIMPRTSSETSKTFTTTLTTVSSTTTIAAAATTAMATTPTTPTTTTTTTTTTSKSPTKPKESEGVDEIKLEEPRAEVERTMCDETRSQDESIHMLETSLLRLQEATNQNRSIVLSRRDLRPRFEPSPSSSATSAPNSLSHPRLQEEPLSLVMRNEAPPRVPSHPAVNAAYEKTPSYMMDHLLASSSASAQPHRNHRDHSSPQQDQQRHQMATTASCSSSSSPAKHHHQSGGSGSGSSSSGGGGGGGGGSGSGGGGGGGSSSGSSNNGNGQQRNYKNMTRERRIEANARERTRVHTISAAFDTLRRAIPAYSHNQKLSKLSVLRIACSYIATLTKICNALEGETMSGDASLAACVDQVSRTIQTEGKLRKRKDD